MAINNKNNIKLPYQQTENRQLNQFQVALGQALQPILVQPMAKSIVLNNISLVSGSTNVIPTTINRVLQGWYPIRVRGQATLWDSQDSNPTPSQTLLLNTSADVVVDIVVF